MSYGLRVWDAAGGEVMNSDSLVERVVYFANVGNTNGSYTVPANAGTGSIKAVCVPGPPYTDPSTGQPWGTNLAPGVVPIITINGRTVTWTWPSTSYSYVKAPANFMVISIS